jgi:hypothetical protein
LKYVTPVAATPVATAAASIVLLVTINTVVPSRVIAHREGVGAVVTVRPTGAELANDTCQVRFLGCTPGGSPYGKLDARIP